MLQKCFQCSQYYKLYKCYRSPPHSQGGDSTSSMASRSGADPLLFYGFSILPTPDFFMASSQSSRLNQKFVKPPDNLASPAGRPVGRPRPTTEFLWVDYKENQSKARDLVRSKQAFVRTRHHRLRRENQVQNGCCPSSHTVSNRHSKRERDNGEDDHPKQLTKFLISTPQACVLDGSPLTVSTKQNPNVYFQHCQSNPPNKNLPFWSKCSHSSSVINVSIRSVP